MKRSPEDYAVPIYDVTTITDEIGHFVLGRLRYDPENDARTWLETAADEIQAILQNRYRLVLRDDSSPLTYNELIGIIAKNFESRSK